MLYGNKFMPNPDERIIVTEQVLLEGTVYKSSIMSVGCFPNPNYNYGDDAYFKVFNNTQYDSASKITRIRFKSPTYIIHLNQVWDLNNKEKKILIRILNSRYTGVKFDNDQTVATVWDALIRDFNSQVKQRDYLPLDLKMPDYRKLRM